MVDYCVSNECIGCGVCYEVAPEHFAVDDSKGIAHVIKQPTTADEIAKCAEAKTSCPVGAISERES